MPGTATHPLDCALIDAIAQVGLTINKDVPGPAIVMSIKQVRGKSNCCAVWLERYPLCTAFGEERDRVRGNCHKLRTNCSRERLICRDSRLKLALPF